MRYLLMIYSDESGYAKMTPDDMGQLMTAYGQFDEEITAAGVVQSSERLQPTEAATCVRVRDGKATTTDGPFAETKEAVGGYYLIDVADLDQALAWARKVPTATYGTIEVRPIWEPEDY
jgi:hypothetical protein